MILFLVFLETGIRKRAIDSFLVEVFLHFHIFILGFWEWYEGCELVSLTSSYRKLGFYIRRQRIFEPVFRI